MDDFPEITPLVLPKDHHRDSHGAASRLARRLGGLARQLAEDRRARLGATVLVCLILLSCLLAQVIPNARERVLALFDHPTSTPNLQIRFSQTSSLGVVVPTLPAGPQPTSVPPVVGTLQPAPSNCPASPPLDVTTAEPSGFSSTVQLHGRDPIWLPENLGYAPNGVITLGKQGNYDPYPSALVIWEVGPTRYPAFTATATDIATGGPAWWQFNSVTGLHLLPVLTVTAVDPSAPTPSAGGFFGFPMGLIFTHSGCYKLDVNWSGGEWYTIFAVGAATS